MDVTAEELREVEFRERFRGYDPDEVDDFLERAAVSVAQLIARVGELTDRVARAEQQLHEGAETEGALRHTLVLAQRTADTAVAEAREAAARVVRDAEEQARSVLDAARLAAQRLAEESQQQLRADIARLESARAGLQADVDALEQYLAEERSRIRSSLTELMWRLEERVDSGLSPRPQPSTVELPPAPSVADLPADPAGEVSAEPDGDVAAPPPPAAAEADDGHGPAGAPAATTPEPTPGRSRWGRPPASPSPSGPRLVYTKRAQPQGGGRQAAAPEPGATPEGHAGPEVDGLPTEAAPTVGDASSRPAHEAAPSDPAAGAVRPSASEVIHWPGKKARPQGADDDFFAALRGALDDDEPLGPRDDAQAAGLSAPRQQQSDSRLSEPKPGSRFRRRR